MPHRNQKTLKTARNSRADSALENGSLLKCFQTSSLNIRAGGRLADRQTINFQIQCLGTRSHNKEKKCASQAKEESDQPAKSGCSAQTKKKNLLLQGHPFRSGLWGQCELEELQTEETRRQHLLSLLPQSDLGLQAVALSIAMDNSLSLFLELIAFFCSTQHWKKPPGNKNCYRRDAWWTT